MHPLAGRTDRRQRPSSRMRLGGLALLLQALLGSGLVALGFPAVGQGPGFEGAARWGWEMQAEFGSSLKLARKLLAETKILTQQFVSERLAGAKLPFPVLAKSGILPPMSCTAQQWLALPALQRLREMRRALVVFRGYVQILGRKDPGLAQGLEEISLDLRDLMHHIDYQVWGSGQPTLPPPGPPAPPILQHPSAWSNLQESYLVLRAMETFLGRVVREFTLLRVGGGLGPPLTPPTPPPTKLTPRGHTAAPRAGGKTQASGLPAPLL
ncbi:LOW QUALITY PROTEIN: interleukin-27 subunit alpha-like [Malaclemys terrapin pileata]|uniref:LOW QUALITY PROTEIN: interleukin-27 subunit alpha-like n=1 Tax=Malaclemys terrapin pileata TaxID=2991368 RepID=UPI0023A8C8D4|nr:LOW QUALITY PROTEIN: interleukin-27 subunit alpha-like [Malaclemys terrapin pileata]